MTELNLENFQEWIGRSEQAEDVVTRGLVERFRATLAGKVDLSGDEVPPCMHWCLAPAAVAETETGADGHPARGGFLPPVPLERRMWGGGKVRFVSPIEVGDTVTRISTIASVEAKQGGSGPLVIVGVDHIYATARGVLVEERQNLIYRDPTPHKVKSSADVNSLPVATHQREIEATTLLMFRYSALTFNGHRIHYDKDHAIGNEGYPGLVFHGPLQATLLASFAQEVEGRPLSGFSYKGVSPLFGGERFTLNCGGKSGGELDLWCANAEGIQTMVATASF